MVKMGTVWDRTIEVLNGRTGMIAPIAVLSILVPSVIRDGYVAFSTPGTMSFALIGSVLAIGTLVAMLWAQLAIVAIASDPGTDAAAARRQAGARVLPALGITALITLIAALLAVPPVIVLVQSGFDFSAAANGSSVQMTPPTAGAAGFTALYGIAYLLLAIWIGARLVLLNPVILNERRGIGAIRRSVQLTKGLTWRIIGVLILFAIVMLVSTWAAQSVTGIIFRLALGADGIATATFLSGIAATIVTTAFTALAAVFTAQLYVAVREKSVTP
ncbi:glycerophosphoryl diester phosphodiesterase family protein [Sphingomonas sp. PP-F2F-A104-K0414]|uniref:glycerophosphoryl diester phosphodiesterase membrane domain-containing protein n=1 Tax=Sphingomonas sp. PP-F2F-A104-K0414 TaxID=2135661 RepID=UPI0010496030|nr:glycerophosphoryl diester phosphodiesterase membrane domain-containing protein [Sphingomonas sp. PP-F2F-A104-K0414]TCQ00016.1 glycerophosphoryl diester phosphodiesterase family protein [Sphingomonas sp. PP-F2F-A104-K0414]